MSDAMFDYLFYTALTIFLLGLIYKVSTWFTKTFGGPGKKIKPSDRAFYAVNGILGIIFSPIFHWSTNQGYFDFPGFVSVCRFL